MKRRVNLYTAVSERESARARIDSNGAAAARNVQRREKASGIFRPSANELYERGYVLPILEKSGKARRCR